MMLPTRAADADDADSVGFKVFPTRAAVAYDAPSKGN